MMRVKYELSFKVHFKFSVPFTYSAFKMELKASLVYRTCQNLGFLLQKKLKYFDVSFVLNQGMKNCKILHKRRMTFIKNIHLEISKDFIEVVCSEKIEKLHL